MTVSFFLLGESCIASCFSSISEGTQKNSEVHLGNRQQETVKNTVAEDPSLVPSACGMAPNRL